VEVNQRALIDKVLARYSGEFTVFRELLQNADDAGATAVQIMFETTQFLNRRKAAATEGANEDSRRPGATMLPRTSRDGNDTSAEAGSSSSVDRPLPALKDIVIGQWTFKNNGTIFREEDWNRLKKIGGYSILVVMSDYTLRFLIDLCLPAEGNPDEQKIGAFGVGFYSLFSVTEEPFVTSGTNWMGFYWKDGKDQVSTRLSA